MTFDDLLFKILQAGLTVELELQGGTLWYNIHTGAKSNLLITKKDYNLCSYRARYSDGDCEEYQEFLYVLMSCLCGRDYASDNFFKFLYEEGLVEKNIETKTSWRVK